MTIEDLILTAITMLKGVEGVDFCYFEEDADWWTLRLWIRRN